MTYGNRDIKAAARKLKAYEGISYTEALARVKSEAEIESALTEHQTILVGAWRSFLEANIPYFESITGAGQDEHWLKVKPVVLEGSPDATAVQIYFQTLSGELHLSNVWIHGEPAIFNLPGDGILRFIQKAEGGDVIEVSVAMLQTRDGLVSSSRFAGMFDLIHSNLSIDGRRKLSDIVDVVPRASIEPCKTWDDVSKLLLVPMGMYYSHGAVYGIGRGIYDARFGICDDKDVELRIYVSRVDENLGGNYEPHLGELGTEDLVIWIPQGDHTYNYTLPQLRGEMTPHEYGKHIAELIAKVQEQGNDLEGHGQQVFTRQEFELKFQN